MSNQVSNRQSNQQVATVKALVESPAYANRFKQVLGEKSQQFVSSLIQISQTNQLQKCDPHSVIAAAMTAAALDLPIDKNLGFAHIVPYKDKAQFQIGTRGFIQLGMRSGQYRLLNVTDVYEGELIKFDRIRAEVIIDQDKKKSDKVVGYVAFMQLVNGFEHSEYWTVEMVEKHAQTYSQSYRGNFESPWKTNFNAMSRKTVLKALLSHWGPMSIQMNTAIVEDQGVHTDIDTEVTYPDNEKEQAKPHFAGPEMPTPKEESKKGKGSKPTVEVDTTVKKADPEEAAAGLAPSGDQGEDTAPQKVERNMAKPWQSIMALTKEAGLEDKDVVEWARVSKNEAGTVLAGKSPLKIMDLREDSAKYILEHWDEVLPLIKQVKSD